MIIIYIERYSNDSFKSQKQIHHLKEIDLILDGNEYEKYLLSLNLNNYQINLILSKIKEKRNFFRLHYDDLKDGIWVFIKGYKNNQSLNHLHKKVPKYYGELPNNVLVYDVNFTKTMNISNDECKLFECYIPKKELSKLRSI